MTDHTALLAAIANEDTDAICREANRLDDPIAYIAAVAGITRIEPVRGSVAIPVWAVMDDGFTLHTTTTMMEAWEGEEEQGLAILASCGRHRVRANGQALAHTVDYFTFAYLD